MARYWDAKYGIWRSGFSKEQLEKIRKKAEKRGYEQEKKRLKKLGLL